MNSHLKIEFSLSANQILTNECKNYVRRLLCLSIAILNQEAQTKIKEKVIHVSCSGNLSPFTISNSIMIEIKFLISLWIYSWIAYKIFQRISTNSDKEITINSDEKALLKTLSNYTKHNDPDISIIKSPHFPQLPPIIHNKQQPDFEDEVFTCLMLGTAHVILHELGHTKENKYNYKGAYNITNCNIKDEIDADYYATLNLLSLPYENIATAKLPTNLDVEKLYRYIAILAVGSLLHFVSHPKKSETHPETQERFNMFMNYCQNDIKKDLSVPAAKIAMLVIQVSRMCHNFISSHKSKII